MNLGTTTESKRTKRARRGTWIAVVVALGWLMLSGWAGPLSGQLSTVQENDNAAFLPASAESTLVADEQAEFATSNAVPILVVASNPQSGPLTADQQQALGSYVSSIPSLPIGDAATAAEFLEPQPIVPIPSNDGEAVLISVFVNGDEADTEIDGEPALIAITQALRTAAEDFPQVQINVTGPGGFLADLIEVFGAIDSALLIATALVVAVILIFVYRSPFLWLIPLVSAGIALSTASAIVYLLAKNDVLVLNGQSQGILTVLVFGAGTDYSLLMVARYREELHRHHEHVDAVKAAWRGTVEAIVASGATTSIGLMILLLSELNSNRSTGPVSATGIVVAVIVMLTLLPALLVIPSVVLPVLAFLVPTALGFGLSFIIDIPLAPFAAAGGVLALVTIIGWIAFGIARIKGRGPFNRERFPAGRWAFWPKTPVFGTDDTKLSGIWAKIAGLTGRRPRFTWVATAIVLLILAGFSTTLKADGISTSDSFANPSEVDSVIGQDILTQHFPGGLGSETIVIANAQSADATLSTISSTPGVSNAYVERELPQGVPGAEQSPIKVVEDRVLIRVTLADAADSATAEDTVIALRSELANSTDADAIVGGPTAVGVDIDAANLRDRNVIIPLVLLVISIILIILLRSLVAPLVLIATVLLSYFATLGASALAFNNIFGFAGADASFPLFAFVFLVALGVDYNIFLMTRVREESLVIGTRPGILKGLTVTGGVITSAGIVLAATFLVLGVLPLVALREVGFAVAVGVLIDAFIVRTTLVPALAYDIGPKIWWPSKLARAKESREPVALPH